MVCGAKGLSDHDLAAIAQLEARTLAAEGGRLKLEWPVLRARSGDEIEDFVWCDGDRCLGFLGLYAFNGATAELAGMVDPAARRRGIGTALLNAALPLCVERTYGTALLVTPHESVGGRGFAISRGAVLEHSEHALLLDCPPAEGPSDPELELRVASLADADALTRVLTAAFGAPAGDITAQLAGGRERTIVAERDGVVLATVRLVSDGDDARIYRFAVDPEWQSCGIGRDVLRRACAQLRDEGAQRIGLEVAVHNERALNLYTSLGFIPITTEDYYQLPLR